eukprot:5535321-Lingulodinium_polyedra.AAC.1
MKHRLGATFLGEVGTCFVCKRALDVKARHAGCCGSAESTKGHYAVTRQLYAFARTVDPTTTKEEATPGEDRQRPGDVTSTVFFRGRRTVAGVGTRFQDSARPGDPTLHYA